jgi:gluconokinase
MVIVVMGVSGTGKTTLGKELAARLDWTFVEADDFHPPTNVAKMRSGVPLEEKDRTPWLTAVNAHIQAIVAAGGDAVLACSALKRAHRDRLSEGVTAIEFVYLEGDPDLIDVRLRERPAHFMPAPLLGSQLATLEPPANALTVSIALPTRRQVDAVTQALKVSQP